MKLRDRLRAALHRHQQQNEPPRPRIFAAIDPAADGHMVIACVHQDGQINLVPPTHRGPLLPERIWDAALERQAVDEYEAEIRRQRFLGRMHVLQLADDAWARYGWTRPKVARR